MTRGASKSLLDPASIDLLLATARSSLTPADVARVRGAVAAIADWTAVVEAALAHGTAGLLCHHILAVGPDLLPEEIAGAAAAFIGFCKTSYARAARELGEVLDALGAARVRALPYKGPVLAALCYAEPYMRGCRDLDVLIHEHDIAATMAALAGLGFRSEETGLTPRQMQAYFDYNGQDGLIADNRMPVEPHWRLSPRTLHAEIETSALFRRAGSVDMCGREIPSPSREDTLLICGLHGSKEEWSRLVWIADVAEQLRAVAGLDWAAILADADGAGVRRMLLIGIALAQRILDAPVSGEIVSALAADPTAGRLAAEASGRLFAGGGNTPSVYRLTRFRLRMRERRVDQVRYVCATLFTARLQHFRFVRLPSSLMFLYPFVRIGHDYIALPLWRLAHSRAAREG